MKLIEFEVNSANTQKLAALSQFLLSRAQDTDAEKKISIAAFVDLAKKKRDRLSQKFRSFLGNPKRYLKNYLMISRSIN